MWHFSSGGTSKFDQTARPMQYNRSREEEKDGFVRRTTALWLARPQPFAGRTRLLTEMRARMTGVQESKIGANIGTSRVSRPYTTFLVTLGLDMMKTASALNSLYAS